MKPTPTKHPVKNLRAFRTALLRWFREQGQDHPWRQTSDPYAIMISEVMLQQTTVAAVRKNRRFERFLATFPDLETLAAAKETDLLKAWEGLGYYNRVRNLQKAARAVLSDHKGSFPSEPEALAKLPGLGRYTAGAIATFAFEKPVPIVDANIARVLARLFDDATPIDSTAGQNLLWERAATLVDPNNPRAFNSAIMELGQTVCPAREPSCLLCPVQNFCQSKTPAALPVKKPKRATIAVDEHVLFCRKPDGSILLMCGDGSRRKGMWHLPERTSEQVSDLPLLATHKYGITHHRVTLHIHACEPSQIPKTDENTSKEAFHPASDLVQLPMPSPYRKALESLLR